MEIVSWQPRTDWGICWISQQIVKIIVYILGLEFSFGQQGLDKLGQWQTQTDDHTRESRAQDRAPWLAVFQPRVDIGHRWANGNRRYIGSGLVHGSGQGRLSTRLGSYALLQGFTSCRARHINRATQMWATHRGAPIPRHWARTRVHGPQNVSLKYHILCIWQKREVETRYLKT